MSTAEVITTPRTQPIPFSGPMVRALLDGRKTQTRRALKVQPDSDSIDVGWYAPTRVDRRGEEYPGENVFGASWGESALRCPYGTLGDRLWVRESVQVIARRDALKGGPRDVLLRYRATPDVAVWHSMPGRIKDVATGRCVPNGCFREGSRLTLEITDVRVERLHDISEVDAKAEGVMLPRDIDGNPFGRHYTQFAELWSGINGIDSWHANPWVWALAFKVVHNDGQ